MNSDNELINAVKIVLIEKENLRKENEELKAQNKTILEDNDNLNKWIDELKAQIEKMKCCPSCKYHRYIYEGNLKSTCKKPHHKADDCILHNYEYWELSE